MKRINRGGSVRGISLKLQEEERERRLDFTPERSVLDEDLITIDHETDEMLRSLNFTSIEGINVSGVMKGGKKHEKKDKKRAPKTEAAPAAQ
jgi:small subunit ribosomal protein S17e